jgi:hypothetical protein
MPLNTRSTSVNDGGSSNGRGQEYLTRPRSTGNTKLTRASHTSGNGSTVPVLNPTSPLYRKKADAGIDDPTPDTDTNNYGGGGNRSYGRYSSYSSGGGGGTVGTTGQDNLAALAAALQAQKQARLDAINAANAALDKQAEAMRNKYATSLNAIGQDYQNLRNQAEVNRYRAQYNQREALANRGSLDSGASRQENMVMNNNYNNNLNTINLQEAQERANVQNAINEMLANVEQQKAQNMQNGLADYTSALQNLINAQYSGYTPEGSAYYQQALQALGANTGAGVTNTPQQNVSDNAYLRYLRAMGYNV